MNSWHIKALTMVALVVALVVALITLLYKSIGFTSSVDYVLFVTVWVLLCAGLRWAVVCYKVFSITSVVELIFIQFVFLHTLKDHKEDSPVARMRFGSMDVSAQDIKEVRRSWLWYVPNNFNYLGCNFSWHWNPTVMLAQCAKDNYLFPDGCKALDLNSLEFQISPTATDADIRKLGSGIYSIISEIPAEIPHWLIGADSRYGIFITRKIDE